jgi:hypothetical protein
MKTNKIGKKIIDNLGIDLNNVIVLSEAGSSMYGTRTPESDQDYLGIYMPTERQLLLNDYPRQVSLPKDSGLDCQMWSIHHFLKLACQGETMAIDLLHAPTYCIVACNYDLWYDLVINRKMFYTKNMKAFVSYARKQAVKYGIKGTRIEAIETVLKYLEGVRMDTKLYEIWLGLPKGNHIHFLDTEPYEMYQVAGQKFQETVTVGYIYSNLKKSLTRYGKRAMLARENKGIDWKAISHAIRCAEQVYDILKFGDYEYPLKNAGFIRGVKMGRWNFKTVVQPVLEEDMNDVEILMESSSLPDEVDKEYWNEWLIKLMRENVLWKC